MMNKICSSGVYVCSYYMGEIPKKELLETHGKIIKEKFFKYLRKKRCSNVLNSRINITNQLLLYNVLNYTGYFLTDYFIS